MNAVNLLGLDGQALEQLLQSLGERPFRARQLKRWIHRHGAADFESMSDLARSLREKLSGHALIAAPGVISHRTAPDATQKWLLSVGGKDAVEAVYIPEPDRATLCISTQAGCGMGCGFCATAVMGLVRNLLPAEIVGQVSAGGALAAPRPLTNIVLMGMGEPLANYDAVRTALEILTAEWGYAISPRRITVSTVGLAPMIPRFIAETRVNLAVSLHATTDAQRTRLVPVNRRYPLATLLAACQAVPLPRRKRITFEYVLLGGENDSDADARRLVQLLHGLRVKVNLIPFNPFPGAAFDPSPRARVLRFQAILREHHLNATIRESRGQDIQAACGQLAVARPAA